MSSPPAGINRDDNVAAQGRENQTTTTSEVTVEIPQFSDYEHYGDMATEEWADALVHKLRETLARIEVLEAALRERGIEVPPDA